MLKVYGSPMCPDCRACKVNFEENGKWKAVGDIGIPGIVGEDGTVFTDLETYLKEKGLPITYQENGPSCSITGKGC